ncbi:MAG: hypothetical protein ABSC11_09135 [Smithella sp.]
MIVETMYSDSLVTITGESILFKRYDIFERDKLVFFSNIKKIIVQNPSIWNGKFRFHGTGDFHTWFSRDFQRYKRDKILFAYIRDKWWRIGFTVENSAAVIKIFQEKGLIRDLI